MPQSGSYLLVIDEYDDSLAAKSAKERFGRTRLRTERYVRRDLAIVRAASRYLLVYSRHSTEQEARKAYQLLRINDPDLVSARIVFVR